MGMTLERHKVIVIETTGMKEQNGICTKSIKQISLTLGTAAGSSSSFKASNDPESCPENSGNKL